jgi:hypothetical protein
MKLKLSKQKIKTKNKTKKTIRKKKVLKIKKKTSNPCYPHIISFIRC